MRYRLITVGSVKSTNIIELSYETSINWVLEWFQNWFSLVFFIKFYSQEPKLKKGKLLLNESFYKIWEMKSNTRKYFCPSFCLKSWKYHLYRTYCSAVFIPVVTPLETPKRETRFSSMKFVSFVTTETLNRNFILVCDTRVLAIYANVLENKWYPSFPLIRFLGFAL